MIHGTKTIGDTPEAIPANGAGTVGDDVEIPANQRLVRVGAYVDGEGGGAGKQLVRAYLSGAGWQIEGAVVAIFADDDPRWLTFPFEPPGGEIPAGPAHVSLATEALSAAGIARLYREAGGPRSIFVEAIAPYVLPDNVDDLYVSRLPFELAQRIFGSTGPVPRSGVTCRAGWHGTKTYPEEGSIAIARTGGPLEGLVGERLRVTRRTGTGERTVFVSLWDEQDWPDDVTDEDFSLSRRAWMEVGLLAEDSIEVLVEVMA